MLGKFHYDFSSMPKNICDLIVWLVRRSFLHPVKSDGWESFLSLFEAMKSGEKFFVVGGHRNGVEE